MPGTTASIKISVVEVSHSPVWQLSRISRCRNWDCPWDRRLGSVLHTPTSTKEAAPRIGVWARMMSVSVPMCAYSTPCLEISEAQTARSLTRVSSGFCSIYLRMPEDFKHSVELPSWEIASYSTHLFRIHCALEV